MPTPTERIRALVACGLLPETAQDVVEEQSLTTVEADARIRETDRTRARIFVLYSPLIPDSMRLMWDAETI